MSDESARASNLATSVLGRDRAALVVVDIQERLASVMSSRDRVVAATVRLIQTAALVRMSIIVTCQYPKGLGELDAEVAGALETVERGGTRVVRVDKMAFDCFGDPAFVSAVEELGCSTLLLAGMETHICVTQTALSGLRRGVEVHVAADATCSRDEAMALIALDRMRAAGAVITVAESAMYELVGVAGTDEFRMLLGIVKG